MDRRTFLARSALGLLGTGLLPGCRGRQVAHVLTPGQGDMVGSHAAGAETYSPLVDEAVAGLLGRHVHEASMVAHHELPPPPKRICFVCVENKSVEEIGDFKDQLYQQIDTQIVQSGAFAPISKRLVDAGLAETRLRPDQLLIPSQMALFAASLERMGQPMDYLLYATLTSGTTQNNQSYQRDYLLTMELVDVNTGEYDKQSATVRKGYHKTSLGRFGNYSFNPFK